MLTPMEKSTPNSVSTPSRERHSRSRRLHLSDTLRIPPAAAIRPRDDLEQMTVRVLEVEAAPAVVAVDLSPLRLGGVGPIGELARLDPIEDVVELGLAHQKRVVL